MTSSNRGMYWLLWNQKMNIDCRAYCNLYLWTMTASIVCLSGSMAIRVGRVILRYIGRYFSLYMWPIISCDGSAKPPFRFEMDLWRSFSKTVDFDRFWTERSFSSKCAKRQFRSEFFERKGNGRLYGATERNGCIQTGPKVLCSCNITWHCPKYLFQFSLLQEELKYWHPTSTQNRNTESKWI